MFSLASQSKLGSVSEPDAKGGWFGGSKGVPPWAVTLNNYETERYRDIYAI